MRSRFVVPLLLSLLLVTLAACQEGRSAQDADIVSQKNTLSGRKTVTVLVKYAFSINTFEAAVEKKFPDIDLVQVGNYTRDMGTAEYESRLEHDDLPDLVMTWPLDIGESDWEDRLLDLSPYQFTNKYNLSMLNNIARDGKLYYLPGPAQVRGIVYNKTLFAENNWAVPTNFDEFVTLCQTIEKSGIRSLQLGFGNSEVLDTAFTGYSYADCYSQPKDSDWLASYNKGEGSFADQFSPALDTFQYMMDKGIFKKSDLDITYSDREKMLFTRRCAMVEDSVLLTRMGYSITGSTDEFALMPFFNPDDGEDWARLYMVCYVGMNKHLADPANKETLELSLKLMDYISTPEGQKALMGDTGAMFSSLIDSPPPSISEINALLPALQNGRYAIFPTLKNAQSALREGLAGLLRGEISREELCRMVDAQNVAPPTVTPPRVLGTASDDFSLKDTGAFVADCLREESGCEIALFLDNGMDGRYNGKGISARLYQGDVTTTDVLRILPDLKNGESGTMWKVTMTGKDLLETLEKSIVVDNDQSGWFYYFSGLRMEYDITAQPGNRIRSITTADQKPIEPDRLYRIAVMDETVPEDFLQSCEKTDLTIVDILERHIEKQKTISPAKDNRFLTVSPS